jgi:hypothetical protein
VLQPRLRELVGDVDWYWLLPQFVHAAHARLEPLPLAHEEVWYVAPLHAERHVLQPATTPASPSGMAAPPSPITCSMLHRCPEEPTLSAESERDAYSSKESRRARSAAAAAADTATGSAPPPPPPPPSAASRVCRASADSLLCLV